MPKSGCRRKFNLKEVDTVYDRANPVNECALQKKCETEEAFET